MGAKKVAAVIEANQRYLSAALAVVRGYLEEYVIQTEGDAGKGSSARREHSDAVKNVKKARRALHVTPPLDTLCSMFGLSPFERDILLLSAGVELDTRFAALCGKAQRDHMRAYPTFSLALAALPHAHWSALTPGAPLRYWRLLDLGESRSVATSQIRIDERILHYLTGLQHMDERLVGIVSPVEPQGSLLPSQEAVAAQVAATWSGAQTGPRLPVVQLCGSDPAAQRSVAADACSRLGVSLHEMTAYDLPLDLRDMTVLMRLWEREAILGGSALLVDCTDLDVSDATRTRAVIHFAEQIRSALLVACREQLPLGRRPFASFHLMRPSAAEQRAAWTGALGLDRTAPRDAIGRIVSQFDLSLSAIQSVAAEGFSRVRGEGDVAESAALAAVLWEGARNRTRPRLGGLAQRITPCADWHDLVLPELQKKVLREIAMHVRQRAVVYEQWGFAVKSERGLGISALFAGESGTGKTMAAEVLARDLGVDLYRIDLSQVVSKYIGETEKNLRKVFDAAEAGGAILLFEEADALFGKRSEVKDSHDRYANIEISYLLQRMEQYRGLAILTTNMKGALDQAFLRRIRFIVQFPFPDAAYRAEIWSGIFPPETPTESLDVGKLARLSVPGGNIRNIAMNAAFLAADAGEPVRMKHLLAATQSEYAKLEKPLSSSEVGGWV
jgi:hypothetical protein